jgi:hypothetical protein
MIIAQETELVLRFIPDLKLFHEIRASAFTLRLRACFIEENI